MVAPDVDLIVALLGRPSQNNDTRAFYHTAWYAAIDGSKRPHFSIIAHTFDWPGQMKAQVSDGTLALAFPDDLRWYD